MGSFRGRNPIISEANSGQSLPHYAWFHTANFLSAPRNSFNPFQSAQLNPESGNPIAPIRYVAAPQTEPAKSFDFENKPSKGKKQKPSTKNSNTESSKPLRPKKPKKNSSDRKKTKGKTTTDATIREKKNPNVAMEGIDLDFSGVPSPVCSCTGTSRVCYKWGVGGWQSSCCTINISEYPLPMSSTRPGSRVAGRKMSNGAYGKLLMRLAAEGHDLSRPVDLRNHWARHGTNKFVTIK